MEFSARYRLEWQLAEELCIKALRLLSDGGCEGGSCLGLAVRALPPGTPPAPSRARPGLTFLSSPALQGGATEMQAGVCAGAGRRKTVTPFYQWGFGSPGSL